MACSTVSLNNGSIHSEVADVSYSELVHRPYEIQDHFVATCALQSWNYRELIPIQGSTQLIEQLPFTMITMGQLTYGWCGFRGGEASLE